MENADVKQVLAEARASAEARSEEILSEARALAQLFADHADAVARSHRADGAVRDVYADAVARLAGLVEVLAARQECQRKDIKFAGMGFPTSF